MKLATWNVNSIRSRKELLLKWLKEDKPDVVLLQETKCLNESFPKDEIEELGYNISIHGQKTFNGIAVLSFYSIDESITSFPNNPVPDEARYLESVISLPTRAIRVISVYVPNGDGEGDIRFKIKLKFLDALREHMKELLKLDEIALVGGDFNVAPEEIDTYDPDSNRDSVLFNIEVRKRLRAILNLGYYDSFRVRHPQVTQFSWWDYRGASWYRNKGMRIDHILLSSEACDLLKDVKINSELRGSINPSDHVPIVCQINI